MESGAEDNGVHVVFGAVGGDRSAAAYFGEAGDHIGIGCGQRGVVGVAEQNALAADAVVGREPGPQGRVGDGAVQIVLGDRLDRAEQPRAVDECIHL
jgi:hypothetical protein